MNRGILYPLIPKPIDVQSGAFSGKLLVDGNISSNLLLFRFQFDTAESVCPLYIQVEVSGQAYQFLCNIRDFANPLMKTLVTEPEFSLKSAIKILGLESPVSFP